MSGHRKPLPDETRVVINRLDGIVAAARITRCPKCQRRELGNCRKGQEDCPAILSGLAHLWRAVDLADEAIGQSDLI